MDAYIATPTVSYAMATRAVSVAMEQAAALGVRAVVSVADPAMALVAFGRADGATPHSAEAASAASSASSASTRRPTGWMPDDLAVALPLGTGTQLTNVKGGVPLAFDGVQVGGLGVAGGTPDQDAQIAVATLEALAADSVEVPA